MISRLKSKFLNFIFFIFFLILTGCNKEFKEFNKIINSNNISYIISKGDSYLLNNEYLKSLKLYKKALSLSRDKKIIDYLIFKIKITDFYKKKYSVSANQLKINYLKHPKHKYSEDILFYSSYFYYLDTPDYNLDQKKTYLAIKELKNFIYKYPNSNRKKKINIFIRNLNKKLEKKYFEISKYYYESRLYNTSINSFNQFINDFPKSFLVEKSKYLILNSKYKLILKKKNYKSLQKKSYEEILVFSKNFIKLYPKSLYIKKIIKIKNNIKNFYK